MGNEKELKIGDRVKIISLKDLSKWKNDKIKIGMKGTVKEAVSGMAGIEFDEYINGHNGYWEGKDGYCWYVPCENIGDIEETDIEETKEEVNKTKMKIKPKTETFEQKILEVLRKEIGVEIGEEFDLYENSEKQWTCKFERNGFFCKIDNGRYKHGSWEYIVCNFGSYTFKRKPFVPKNGEVYFFLEEIYDENKNISFIEGRNTWNDSSIDYGRAALENVFRSKKEALANKDKLAEKLEKLRKGE